MFHPSFTTPVPPRPIVSGGPSRDDAMKRTRRLTITVSRPVPSGEVPARLFCPTCRKDVVSLTFVQLAGLLGTDELGVVRLAATGRVHLVTTSNGDARVCGPSMAHVARAAPVRESRSSMETR